MLSVTENVNSAAMVTIPFSYRVGGALAWNEPTYIKRTADTELYHAIERGQFSYVLGPRQIGKSSLRIHTCHRLVQQGYRCITLQASQLRSPGQSLSNPAAGSIQDRECSAFISAIWIDLGLGQIAPLRAWLQKTASLSTQARLARFSQDFLLGELLKTPIVIFIDEIDALLEVPFIADLLRWIEQCDRRRQTEAAYQNLSFVILGTTTVIALLEQSCTADAIVKLFANGCQISLSPFKLSETFSLRQGFEEKIADPTVLLQAIFRWTQGQPFLTQKICHIASNLIGTLVQPSASPIKVSTKIVNHWIDDLVRSHIIKNWTFQDTPIHLRAIRDRLIYSPHHRELISLYKAIYRDTPVSTESDAIQAELLLTGIVDSVDSRLQITNPIYREVFSVSESS